MCFWLAGFTAVDVLAHGTMGHVIAVGLILGLRVSILIQLLHHETCLYAFDNKWVSRTLMTFSLACRHLARYSP